MIQVRSDLPELFDGDFEVFDDFLGEDVRIREIVGFFQSALVAVDEFLVIVCPPVTIGDIKKVGT